DPSFLAEQLTTKGQVTALGSVMQEVGQQLGSSRLTGVIIFSDFANNSGVPPAGSGPQSPTARLGIPIYTVGVGATEAIDLPVDLQTDPKMKKAERSFLVVKLRQSGLEGQAVTVRVNGRKLSGELPAATGAEFNVGQRTVMLKNPVATIELPFTPAHSGRCEVMAVTDKLVAQDTSHNHQA